MTFDILVACTKNGGIGKNGTIPWYLPPDLKWFQQITSTTRDPHKQNAIIMGKNTWKSLPKKPLRGRRNIVLTTSLIEDDYKNIISEGGEIYHSLEDALFHLQMDQTVEGIYVIGGEKLYEIAVLHPDCRNIYLTRIENGGNYNCDTFFPINVLTNDTEDAIKNNKFINTTVSPELSYNGIRYSCKIYSR